MKTVKRIELIKTLLARVRKKGKTIGFVPTMGYLHEGHLSLARRAREKSDYVVVSIFVNPTQFGPAEDFDRYPRDLRRDARLLRKEKTDLIFCPSVKEIYPDGHRTYVEVSELGNVLCGASRPGHFRGVTTVVLKLFNIIKPDIAVFGQKDFQQVVIIKKMVADLDLSVEIITAPTVREKDGLAMSSRNAYLMETERKNAVVLYQALNWARDSFYNERIISPDYLVNKMTTMIEAKEGKVDYIAAVDPDTLKPIKVLQKGALIALAVYFGRTRLIDNIVV
jgi:pantoate--beta-alanine ligase